MVIIIIKTLQLVFHCVFVSLREISYYGKYIYKVITLSQPRDTKAQRCKEKKEQMVKSILKKQLFEVFCFIAVLKRCSSC